MVPGGLRNPPTGSCICGWGALTLSDYSWLEPGNSCPQPTPQIVAWRSEEKTQTRPSNGTDVSDTGHKSTVSSWEPKLQREPRRGEGSQMYSSPLPFITEVGIVCTSQESPFLRFIPTPTGYCPTLCQENRKLKQRGVLQKDSFCKRISSSMDHLLQNGYTIPASWKKHGFLDEHGTREKDVPAGPNIIRTEKKRQ